ncbi:MAG: tRNA (adenosine(37)-N6)-threonylcarbamoyltransferase complex ATPase subunit type 1 TsaE, partial [Mucinivorans sp.]
ISCFANLHGSRQTPSSPTFAIINTYDAKDVTIYHFDLYRVDDRREVEDLALEEYFYADNAISLVEWPEKIEAFLPQELTLRIKIDVLADNVRKFSVIN